MFRHTMTPGRLWSLRRSVMCGIILGRAGYPTLHAMEFARQWELNRRATMHAYYGAR